jgi:hypothetical protein
VLPNESPYNSPDVVRALFSTIAHNKITQKKQPKFKKSIEEKESDNTEKGLPKNAGLPWTEEQKMS